MNNSLNILVKSIDGGNFILKFPNGEKSCPKASSTLAENLILNCVLIYRTVLIVTTNGVFNINVENAYSNIQPSQTTRSVFQLRSPKIQRRTISEAKHSSGKSNETTCVGWQCDVWHIRSDTVLCQYYRTLNWPHEMYMPSHLLKTKTSHMKLMVTTKQMEYITHQSVKLTIIAIHRRLKTAKLITQHESPKIVWNFNLYCTHSTPIHIYSCFQL